MNPEVMLRLTTTKLTHLAQHGLIEFLVVGGNRGAAKNTSAAIRTGVLEDNFRYGRKDNADC
jgi:hypothetical protein